MGKKPKTDLGRKEAGAVTWLDSDVLHDLPRFCHPRNFPAEQPSLEKQQFNRSTAFSAFCRSVSSISRHLTGWGRDGFICESSISPMKERLSTQGWEKGTAVPAYLQVHIQGCNICRIIPSYLLVGCQGSSTAKSGICCPSGILDQILQWGLIALLPSRGACYRIRVCEMLYWKHLSCPAACKAEGLSHKGSSCAWISDNVMCEQQKRSSTPSVLIELHIAGNSRWKHLRPQGKQGSASRYILFI